MGYDIGGSSLVDAQRGDVESLLVLALDHVVRKHCVAAGHQFRGRVAEHGAAVERHIVLDECGLAVILRHNEIARMTHGWRIVGRRDEQQADGLLHPRASSAVDIRSAWPKSRVQGPEGTPRATW